MDDSVIKNVSLQTLIDEVKGLLVESERRFRFLFERSPDPIFLMEKNIIIDCNYAAINLLNYNDKELLIGKRPLDISPEIQPDGISSADKESQFYTKVYEKGHANFEWVFQTSQCNQVWADVFITLVPIREKLLNYVIWHDVTEKKKIEAHLRETEANYKSIFENAVNGIFQVTPQGSFIRVNRALAKMFGFDSPGDLIANILNIEDQYVTPRDREDIKRLMEDKGFVEGFETELYKKDKSKIYVSINARAVKNASGKVLYHEGFIEDITKRKEAEMALLREREDLNAILNNMPMGVIITDINGVFLFVNLEFTNITGYTYEDVPTGREWFKKAYPDQQYRYKVIEFWRDRVLAKKREWVEEEFTIRCKNGEKKDIEFRSIILRDYIITILADITTRKRAEMALKISEEKFRLLFEKSIDPILLLNRKRRIIDCNEAALKLLRCKNKGDLIGLNPTDISPDKQPDGKKSSEKSRKIMREALRKGTSHFEWMLKKSDGENVLVEGSFSLIALAGEPILFTLWRDITERRRSEEAIKRAEENYRTIFENAMEGIFQTTPDGRILNANSAFARLFGFETPEDIMTSVKDVASDLYVDPKRRIELKSFLESDGFVNNFEIQCRRKDGKIIWVNTNMRAVYNHSKKINYFEGTMVDITERKTMLEELGIKSKSLEEANAALNILLKHREQDTKELEEKVVNNIKELVLPYIEKLKAYKHYTNEALIDIIENNLNEVVSPFIKRLTSRYLNFTPSEIRVADMIKKGKTTKEISQLLGLSTRTIDIHRYNIRKKLNLVKKKVNLQSYLHTFTG
ncbi:MAG TPA: PAS domain S-box protein [Syntrophorhabdaceae bacterium]|nr:PAS domain S-box protein [Syntrophorhabdaceae bacterium]HOT41343.1 PAS domain S-box protein [Syntrophorhabdaceae bacterium]HPC66679.1 PAS domain S-box protein [Syntrophorhabdaceae bacterium]HQE79485.1 PAS domain S-box protein [Syntrophorhabdaceae bacterium]HQK45392.1 PAS domain S-box protein [Syntrophorhabdaceae bacterium]